MRTETGISRRGLLAGLFGGVVAGGAGLIVQARPDEIAQYAAKMPLGDGNSVAAGIGVGYLDRPGLAPGTKAAVVLHGREVPAEIVKVPFYRSPHLPKGA